MEFRGSFSFNAVLFIASILQRRISHFWPEQVGFSAAFGNLLLKNVAFLLVMSESAEESLISKKMEM